jgi:hypothetical protein
MTEKEKDKKALGLCQKMGWCSSESEQTNFNTLELAIAKKCALVAVEEILSLLPTEGYLSLMFRENIKDWKSIEDKIKKL